MDMPPAEMIVMTVQPFVGLVSKHDAIAWMTKKRTGDRNQMGGEEAAVS